MSSRQSLASGQLVKYREAAQVYPATVCSDLEDDIYCLNVERSEKLTATIPAHRLDIYAEEDLPHLIDDLFGVSEDALAEIHQLLNRGSNAWQKSVPEYQQAQP